MTDNSNNPTLVARLRDGLERVATVLKVDQWAASTASGLNPTQLLALGLLSGRPDGLRVSALADHLGISQPTATDAIASLEAKALVARQPDANDARARRILITRQGRTAVNKASETPSLTEDALQTLSPELQQELLVQLLRLIRQFQLNGSLPTQRICGTCKYFHPFKHRDAAVPHHCAFVNAAFGNAELRTDCGDHETASPADQTAIWSAFETGQAHLQAKSQP